jgi:aminopeptidase N
VNKLELDLDVDASGVITKFNIQQSAIDAYPVIRDHRMAVGFYNLVDGKIVRTEKVELDVSGVSTAVPAFVGMARPDLILLNDDDLAYAKIRLDDASWKFALENLDKFEDSLARTMIWMAAWDAMRDGETPARDFVDLVLNNIQSETQGSALQTLLRQMVTVTAYYVARDTQDATFTKVAKRLWELTQAAEAGSDAQYMFLKFWAIYARGEFADTMEQLLSGERKLPGRVIDQDQRWWLIMSLVAVERLGKADIEAELAKDNTANGQKFAFHAEGNLPGNKQAYFDRLISDKELSNTLIGEGVIAFQEHWDSNDFVPFVDQYFEMVLPAWESRTFKIAEYLIEGLYPTALASDALVKRTQDFINSPEVSS